MIRISKLTGFMGAEVTGAELTRPIPDGTAVALRRALAEHQMIVLRGQHLSIADQKRRLARIWSGSIESGRA